MADLDTLGRRHRKLQDELDALRGELADAIRAEREAGATYQQLLQRSGYGSQETIRQIVKPEARERVYQARKATP
jgi:DNA-binding TFAR19-related protein (PDSD5 family)